MNSKKKTLGWGRVEKTDVEIWDTAPIFLNDTVLKKDWLKLLFYPKKWFLYRAIKKDFDSKIKNRTIENPYRILDVGCGTGSTLIDLKKIFGRRADVIGVDVVKLQVDIGKEKIKKNAVLAQIEWYDGGQLPFSNNSFDAVYTSDVLGHVREVPKWLNEINRVLRPNGMLAMFSESEIGKHAIIRKYLFNHGLNVDPHAEFHISLYEKNDLKDLITGAGFKINRMYSAFWASYFVHPDEFYEQFKKSKKFFLLRNFNKLLYWLKKKTHPYSTAACEFYGLVEMYLIGRWIESQGYVILASKKDK